jgi:DNA-directed RNA polymerase subunit RPC12/RpoP
MTIEFHCPHCDKLLKTADDKAGVQANCPGCGEAVLVPAASEVNALYDESFAPGSGRRSDAGPPPVPAAGRAVADSTGGAPTKACPMCGERIMAGASRCRFCGEELSGDVSRRSLLAAHRGGMILAFGIIGFLVCFPFGIAAWVMGNNDLREMAAGRMDRAGEGLTQAGKIIGIVTCCLQLLSLAIIAFVMVLTVVGALNR